MKHRLARLVAHTAAALLFMGALGCHGDTQQGGGSTAGSANQSRSNNAGRQSSQQPVPTPPSADQISPSSPQAILHGDSTTQPATPPKTTTPSSSSPQSQ